METSRLGLQARRIAIAVAAVSAALVCPISVCSCGQGGDEIMFRFKPPDGTTYVETVKTTKVSHLGAEATRTDTSEVKAKTVITKTAGGYRAASTALSVSATRNGRPFADPLITSIKGLTIVHELDEHGQSLAIRGYDEFLKRMREQLDPAVIQAVSAVLNEEAMNNKTQAEWRGRVASFVGRAVRVGDAWEGVDEYSLPSGEKVVFYSITKVAERVKHAGRDCVKIEFHYDTDAEALGEFTGKILKDVRAVAGASGPELTVAGTKLTGGGQRVVDPATMLIYGETWTRTVEMPMNVSGRGIVTVKAQETREYSYDYGSQENR